MRRTLAFVFLFLILMAVITLLWVFFGETREYRYETLLSQELDPKKQYTGGSIAMDDLDRYRIVHEWAMDEEGLDSLYAMRDRIAEKTGIFLEIYSTEEGKWKGTSTVARHEILIGLTYRKESQYLYDQTWEGGASCAMVGKKLVFTWGREADPAQALEYLTDLLLENCETGSEYFFEETDAYTDNRAAPVQSLSLNGLSISAYTIINGCEKDSSHYEASLCLAEYVRQQLGDICGYLLPVRDLDDKDLDLRGILYVCVQPTFDSLLNDLFEPAVNTAQWCLYGEEAFVNVTGTSSYCTARAVKQFLAELTPSAPLDSHEVWIEMADPVSLPADLSVLRIDMNGQYYYADGIQDVLGREYPDLYTITRTETPYFYGESGYYSLESIGTFGHIYYCTERFRLVEEDDIRFPIGAEWSDTLRGAYCVLEDLMTRKEIAIVEMDVTEDKLEAFEKTLQFVSYPEREVLFLRDIPSEAISSYFTAAVPETEETFIRTLISGSLQVVSAEEYSDVILEEQEKYFMELDYPLEAYRIHLQYAQTDPQ